MAFKSMLERILTTELGAAEKELVAPDDDEE
jgi:hypothetical protein